MEKISKVVVIWWWTAWVLSVLYLHKYFPEIEIIWIFPEDNNTIWVWEATIPMYISF